MMKLKSLFSVIFCAAVAAFMISCAAPPPQVNNQENKADLRRERLKQIQQMKIWYNNTSGKAGFHMVSQPRADCPITWNSNDPSIIDGYLPPGLTLDKFNIVGTPQQPGNWLVKIRFTSISCQGRSYPDQDVDVYFNIQGDAPRGLE